MIKNHVATSLMVEGITKRLKYLYCLFARDVRKDAHLNGNLSQKYFFLFIILQSPIFFFYF